MAGTARVWRVYAMGGRRALRFRVTRGWERGRGIYDARRGAAITSYPRCEKRLLSAYILSTAAATQARRESSTEGPGEAEFPSNGGTTIWRLCECLARQSFSGRNVPRMFSLCWPGAIFKGLTF